MLHLSLLKKQRLASVFILSLYLMACTNHQAVIEEVPAIATASLPTATPVDLKNVSLSNLKLNDQENRIIVKPSSVVQAKVNYSFHCPKCYKNLNSQIMVGLANRSAQACIYDNGSDAEGVATFNLKAPAKPGKYEIRFSVLQSKDCKTALQMGWDADNSPPSSTTIGMIIASKNANF